MTNGHQLDSIDSRLERLTQAVEQQHQNIEELIAGMGLLIEASTEFRSDLAEIKTTTQQQAETAERQERNIQQLAETVSRQAETAERQSRIFERLIERQE